MKDPVICIGDQITYERAAIEKYFRENDGKSPSTHVKLSPQDLVLIANRGIMSAIEDFFKAESEAGMGEIHTK